MAIQEFASAIGVIQTNGRLNYRIYLTRGQSYQFSVSAINGSNLDSDMRIYSANGSQNFYNNDFANSINPQIGFTAASTGYYFISIGAGSSGGSGTFRLSANYNLSPTNSREYAANSGTEGLLKIGGSTNSIIDFASDSDWFRISIQKGLTYQFNLFASGESAIEDTLLNLRDSSGTIIASNDDISYSDHNFNSRITYLAQTTGDYFLDARGFSGATGSYTLGAKRMIDGLTINQIEFINTSGARNGLLSTGDSLWINVSFSDTITVSGKPSIGLNIGGNVYQAEYESSSNDGSSILFRYTIQAGQEDINGISINTGSISLNNGSIQGAEGNAASLLHNNCIDNPNYRVDAIAPSATISPLLHSDLDPAGTLLSWGDSTIDHTLNLSGSMEPGATVTLLDGQRVLGQALTLNSSWSLETPYLSNGLHNLNIMVTDLAGNEAFFSGGSVLINQPWSSISGWGQVDVLSALEIVTRAELADIPEAQNETQGINAGNFNDAWFYGYSGKGVTIAAIDSGLDLSNSDLTGNISPWSWDFVNNDADVSDDHGHGTFIASQMIAANNAIGLTGAAYDASLMVLKVLDANGSGNTETVCAAIRYAVDHNADVINISLGGGQYSGYESALNYAYQHDVAVIMAAGNDADPLPLDPANYAQLFDNCIAVGALEATRDEGGYGMAYFSNQAGVDTPYGFVNALGTNLAGYSLNQAISSWSGTSIATPYVTSAVALMLSANENLTAIQAIQAITSSAHALS
jgi:subtilisin family serine protease